MMSQEGHNDERESHVMQAVIKFHDFTAILDRRNQGRKTRGEDPLKFDPFRGQGRILRMLSVDEGVAQSRLAAEMGVSPQALSVSIRKLVSSGLVEQRHARYDKRSYDLFLTEDGAGVKELLNERSKYSGSMFEALSDGEIDVFCASLDKLIEHMSSEIKYADLSEGFVDT